MLVYLDHNTHSTQPMYETCYIMKTVKSMGYTSEPINYEPINEKQFVNMSLAYAGRSFSEDWDIDDQEENEYWNSLA